MKIFIGVVVFFVHILPGLCALDCPTNDKEYDADVLILGGGMAGIAAAKTLHESGIENFLVLEALGSLGGRIRSAVFAGERIELGANWVHGTSEKGNHSMNPVLKMTIDCDIKGVNMDYSYRWLVYDGSKPLSYFDGLVGVDAKYQKAKKKVIAQSKRMQKNREPDITVQQAFKENGWGSSTPLEKIYQYWYHDLDYGEPPSMGSLFLTLPDDTYEHYGEGMFMVRDERGFEEMVQCYANSFMKKSDPRLHFNTLVTDIEHSDNCVCVLAVSGGRRKRFCAKHAIVTFSIGVLQSKRGKDMFHPSLPLWKSKAIDQLKMIHLLKVFIKFQYPFWETGLQLFGHTQTTKNPWYPVFLPMKSSRTGAATSIIMTLTTYNLSDNIYHQPESLTKRQIQKVLQEIYPKVKVPMPDELFIPSWKQDPLFYGCYVDAPFGTTAEDFKLIGAPIGKLHFSGEGASKEFHGYIHGAYFAGIKTAKEVIQSIQTNS